MKMMVFTLLVTLIPTLQTPDRPQDAPDLVVQSFEWGSVSRADVADAPEVTAENSGRPVDLSNRSINRIPGMRPPIADTDPWSGQSAGSGGDLTRQPITKKEANALVKNLGAKTIKSVEWEYIFYSNDDPAKELKRYKFRNKIKIAPGETKFLNKDVSERALSKRQKVRITRLEYTDNSTWQRAESAQ
jgi:hypothetical protein